ncbi:uncharacterized protein LODBEIA_P45720 [Lodderomyces beijingensis]|uniref:Uncharacterized protein n=1 Tax=Lodderomyces beijingensis TaxID=1775926 RepID=A0ABP0ZQB3_9ASCO
MLNICIGVTDESIYNIVKNLTEAEKISSRNSQPVLVNRTDTQRHSFQEKQSSAVEEPIFTAQGKKPNWSITSGLFASKEKEWGKNKFDCFPPYLRKPYAREPVYGKPRKYPGMSPWGSPGRSPYQRQRPYYRDSGGYPYSRYRGSGKGLGFDGWSSSDDDWDSCSGDDDLFGWSSGSDNSDGSSSDGDSDKKGKKFWFLGMSAPEEDAKESRMQSVDSEMLVQRVRSAYPNLYTSEDTRASVDNTHYGCGKECPRSRQHTEEPATKKQYRHSHKRSRRGSRPKPILYKNTPRRHTHIRRK